MNIPGYISCVPFPFYCVCCSLKPTPSTALYSFLIDVLSLSETMATISQPPAVVSSPKPSVAGPVAPPGFKFVKVKRDGKIVTVKRPIDPASVGVQTTAKVPPAASVAKSSATANPPSQPSVASPGSPPVTSPAPTAVTPTLASSDKPTVGFLSIHV